MRIVTILLAGLLARDTGALVCQRCHGLECATERYWQTVQCSEMNNEECYALNSRQNRSTYEMGCTSHSCRRLKNDHEYADCDKCDDQDSCNRRLTIGVGQNANFNQGGSMRQDEWMNSNNHNNQFQGGGGFGSNGQMMSGGGLSSNDRYEQDRFGGGSSNQNQFGGGSNNQDRFTGGGSNNPDFNDFNDVEPYNGPFAEISNVDNPFHDSQMETNSCFKCRGDRQCAMKNTWEREDCTTPPGGRVKPACYALRDSSNNSLYEMGCSVNTCRALRAYRDSSQCRKCAGDYCNQRFITALDRLRTTHNDDDDGYPKRLRRHDNVDHGHDGGDADDGTEHSQSDEDTDPALENMIDSEVRARRHDTGEPHTHSDEDHDHASHGSRLRRHNSGHTHSDDHETDHENMRRRRHETGEPHTHSDDHETDHENMRRRRHETGEPHTHSDEDDHGTRRRRQDPDDDVQEEYEYEFEDGRKKRHYQSDEIENRVRRQDDDDDVDEHYDSNYDDETRDAARNDENDDHEHADDYTRLRRHDHMHDEDDYDGDDDDDDSDLPDQDGRARRHDHVDDDDDTDYDQHGHDHSAESDGQRMRRHDHANDEIDLDQHDDDHSGSESDEQRVRRHDHAQHSGSEPHHDHDDHVTGDHDHDAHIETRRRRHETHRDHKHSDEAQRVRRQFGHDPDDTDGDAYEEQTEDLYGSAGDLETLSVDPEDGTIDLDGPIVDWTSDNDDSVIHGQLRARRHQLSDCNHDADGRFKRSPCGCANHKHAEDISKEINTDPITFLF